MDKDKACLVFVVFILVSITSLVGFIAGTAHGDNFRADKTYGCTYDTILKLHPAYFIGCELAKPRNW